MQPLDQSQIQAQEQLQQLIQAAGDSRRLLSNPVLVEFFDSFERKCFDAADKLPLNDTAGRDRAYFLVTLCRKFRKTLEYYAENGEYNKKQLDELLGASKKPFLGGLLG